jgi:hypothetical protein
MYEGGMECEIFFLTWGIEMRKMSRFLHNLLINIETARNFLSQNSLQPVLVI